MLEKDVFAIYLRAGNSTDCDELLRLAAHGETLIRMRVAENVRTPLATMVKLASDSNPEVRAALSENPAVPNFIMTLLAEDEHSDVRFSVADNPHTPIYILAKLILDSNCFVAARARKWFERSIESFELVQANFQNRKSSRSENSAVAS